MLLNVVCFTLNLAPTSFAMTSTLGLAFSYVKLRRVNERIIFFGRFINRGGSAGRFVTLHLLLFLRQWFRKMAAMNLHPLTFHHLCNMAVGHIEPVSWCHKYHSLLPPHKKEDNQRFSSKESLIPFLMTISLWSEPRYFPSVPREAATQCVQHCVLMDFRFLQLYSLNYLLSFLNNVYQ